MYMYMYIFGYIQVSKTIKTQHCEICSAATHEDVRLRFWVSEHCIVAKASWSLRQSCLRFAALRRARIPRIVRCKAIALLPSATSLSLPCIGHNSNHGINQVLMKACLLVAHRPSPHNHSIWLENFYQAVHHVQPRS